MDGKGEGRSADVVAGGGGWATANVLLGRVNPGGRLPFTWGRRLEDYPATDPVHPERSAQGVEGKTTFSEGLDVGYRWFDKEKIEPLFPFGYGLSYSTFSYSDLRVTRASDNGLDISVHVTNTGNMSGGEVPQVYLDAPERRPEGVQFAMRTLVAFDRVTLRPGEPGSLRCMWHHGVWSTGRLRRIVGLDLVRDE